MSLQSNENNPKDLFNFAGSVGRFGDNDRADVIKAQALLANAGCYDLPEPGMPTGWPGGELNRALIRFQKDHGLEPDGILLPLGEGGVTRNGIGETLFTLRDKLGDHLEGYAPPSVQEVDDFYRLRPMLDSDGEPQTNVVLRSGDGGSGEPIGLKPVVMSDEPPEQVEPKAGEQTAYAGKLASEIIKQGTKNASKIPNLLRDLGILAPAATLALPADTPQTDSDALRPPEPAQPEEDRQQQDFAKPQRGRIVIAEDGKELHVPPLGAWADKLNPEDRQIADALNDALAEEMALRVGGSRGNALTQAGVNIAIQECLKELRTVLPEAAITHEFGGNPEGKAEREAKKEEHLWQYNDAQVRMRKGSNRSDFSILIARNVAEMLRGNTYDGKDGKPDERESNAEANIREKTEGEEFVMVEKRYPDRSEEQFRRDVRDVCRAAAERIRAKWDQGSEFAKPTPDKPADYDGPPNARRARKLRELRERQ